MSANESVAESYIIPPSLIARADISRLAREVETMENELEAQKVRGENKDGGYHLLTMSQGLRDFLDANKIDVTNDQARMQLKEQVRAMKDKAPIIHMTFAVTADPESLQELLRYIRSEIHPQALLSVGLQPSLVGGVYLRTPNHVHDFSVRMLLAGKRDIIMKELEAIT